MSIINLLYYYTSFNGFVKTEIFIYTALVLYILTMPIMSCHNSLSFFLSPAAPLLALDQVSVSFSNSESWHPRLGPSLLHFLPVFIFSGIYAFKLDSQVTLLLPLLLLPTICPTINAIFSNRPFLNSYIQLKSRFHPHLLRSTYDHHSH